MTIAFFLCLKSKTIAQAANYVALERDGSITLSEKGSVHGPVGGNDLFQGLSCSQKLRGGQEWLWMRIGASGVVCEV